MTAEDSDPAVIADRLRRKVATLQFAVGEAALLLMRHSAHRHRHLGDLRRLLLSPVLLNQYRFVRDRQDRSVGFATWAWVDDEVRQRLMDSPSALRPGEWHCGDIPVVMLCAGPSAAAERKILDAVAQAEFGGAAAWRVRAATTGEPGLVTLESPPGNGIASAGSKDGPAPQ